MLASLASSVLGSKAGALAAGFAQLERTGLINTEAILGLPGYQISGIERKDGEVRIVAVLELHTAFVARTVICMVTGLVGVVERPAGRVHRQVPGL